MSEYWKSTPKYWCKFCSTYVKDTQFERRNHEATGKHQGSVQRSLKNIHKEHDKGEREKARAKAEVERLNSVVAGKPTAAKDTGLRPGQSARTAAPPKPPASVEERKRQMQQLAEMGIAVPEEFRKDMAMAGQWQTITPQRADEDVTPDTKVLNVGVRKRKLAGDEAEEEEAVAAASKRKGWGRDLRTYPDQAGVDGEADIEALLKGGAAATPAPQAEADITPRVKKEESNGDEDVVSTTAAARADAAGANTGSEAVTMEDADVKPVVFKFKKPKAKVAKT